ncbi:MYXO-CTERM sorting domain-containing protein [Nannocystis exedens]|uniref:MYXO-CTERM sorting domain-containing protein n=1 Tax=Nannocystis exedens TaxID=54 RepID=UPI000BBA08DE|nr:MYXO-CTERM sorting domain-containing protein [Nannocystis exedens]
MQGTTARADVVEEPPADCPAGTKGNTCHGGPFCSPLKCFSDAECTDGATCQDTKGCIGWVDCGGGDGGPDPTPTLSSLCDGGEACGAGETCEAIKLCLPVVEPTTGGGSAGGPTSSGTATTDAGTASGTGDDPGGSKGGCGSCSADADPGATALALLAIAALVPRRRRNAPGRP